MKANSQSGQILILALVFVVIITALVSSIVVYTLSQTKVHRAAVARESALSIAEAGVEAAIWKFNNQVGYTGETNTVFGSGTYTVTVTPINSYQKLVKVDSYIPNAANPTAHRTVQVLATIGTKNFGFKYGVQVGTGGFIMDNNSQVTGNVYANGDIIGGNNGSVITGDAVVAGPAGSISSVSINGNSKSHSISNSTVSGNASHYSLASTTVGGNVSADTISGPGCSITGDATYNVRSNCSVSGTATTPNPSVPPDPTAVPLPVDDAQTASWENEAANGGTINGYTITGTESLGPTKINGNLIVNGVLNLTGTLWITGNLTLNNGSTIQLDTTFGALSGVIVVGSAGSTTDGYINISNGSVINGSGTSGSYVMLLSERDTRSNGNVAITAGNNVAAAILYANYGLVEVINNATLKEITAWKTHLNNLATVVYDNGYASADFSTGPAGGWQVAEKSWQLLR